ncbi:hypothetical protein FBY14_101310 [Azospirillum brasilense]|nr:hypothetical protein FBY14_101310 [Azospirillum brasilense]
MSEFAKDLVGAARRVAEGSGQARRWVEEVRASAVSVANEAHGLRAATRRSENLARKLIGAAGRRNCVGVFGPSQAGKSYLVSALARSRSSSLTADFGRERKDFLTEINPPGDRESTGLVTRFTVHRDGPVDPEHPVELRLLSETDLVKILANSFLSDFDPNNMTVKLPDEAEIRQVLATAEAEATGTPAAHLDEIALYDLGEYFQRNFAARIRALDNTDYWEGVIRHAARLTLAGRARLFAMLWGNLGAFTDLFLTLAGALERLSHAPDARAALTALVPRETSIIDVEVLKRALGTPEDARDLVSVRPLSGSAAGAPVPLPRATLTALVAELKIVMADTPWPFFQHTDLLDFPGARSRLKLPCLPSDDGERTAQVRELLLRGKIAYLFQRFTEERELTAMLLCMPPSTAEVKDLAPMVRGWIEVTHGATPEARARARTALFLMLTKFDLEFVEKGGETAESRRGKWDRRLGASFLELYGKDGWPENWDGKPFANTLFLRNPGMKQLHLMDYTDQQRLVEAGPSAAQADMIAEYRAAFENSPLCARHVADRGTVWDAAFMPNDGGVTFLVDRLNAVLDPALKEAQIRQRLQEEAAHLEANLRRFHHADDDASRREREQALNATRVRLNQAMKPTDYTLFGHLLERLQVREATAREIFLNAAALKLDRFAPAPAEAPPPVPDDDPWGAPAVAPAEAPPPARRPAADRPAVFAEQVMNHWTEHLRALSQDAGLLARLGLPAAALDDLVQEVIVGAHRRGLGDAIAEGVRAQVQAAHTRWDDVVDRAVGIAMMRLNDYVAGLGFAGLDEAARPGFPEAPQPRARAIFTPPPVPAGLPPLDGRRLPMERDRFIDWGVAFRQLGLDNVSFAGGREIGEAHNRALGEILATIAIAQPTPITA